MQEFLPFHYHDIQPLPWPFQVVYVIWVIAGVVILCVVIASIGKKKIGKMKHVTDLLAPSILVTLRRQTLTLLIAWLVVGLFLVVVYQQLRPKTFRVISGRIVTDQPGNVVLEIRTRNDTDRRIEVLSAKLTAKNNSASTGGLQTMRVVSARYVVTNAVIPTSRSSDAPSNMEFVEADVVYPYAGRDDHAYMLIPVSQTLDENDADRFEIAIQSADFPKEQHRLFVVSLRYDDDLWTSDYTIHR